MLQDIDLRTLAELRGNGRDVVSAYFAGREGLSQLQHRERQLRDLLEDDPLEADNFEQSMQRIRDWLDEHSVDDSTSVCVFSSEILDFLSGHEITMEVPNRLYVGSAPFIRPLAELQDEYETFLMVACDNTRTRIFSVTNEITDVESVISGGIKNHVRKGGWSQKRYERRRDEQLSRYAREIAGTLAEIVRTESIHRVVMLGSAETMHAIEEEMDAGLRQHLVGSEAFDLDRDDDELLQAAYESYFEAERDDESDLWQQIKNEALSGGRAVTGPAPTLAAAMIGRVEAAVVTRDAKITGTMCRDCEHVHVAELDRCRDCDSQNVFAVDVVDTLARQLELTSAQIDFVDPLPGLSRSGDIAALLRY